MSRGLSLGTRVRQDGFCCPYMAIKETRHVKAKFLAQRWRVSLVTLYKYRKALANNTLACEGNELCGKCPATPVQGTIAQFAHILPGGDSE